ncbi:MAG TPA: hypothetical protein VF857_01435 [Spirochaetota bacterium]
MRYFLTVSVFLLLAGCSHAPEFSNVNGITFSGDDSSLSFCDDSRVIIYKRARTSYDFFAAVDRAPASNFETREPSFSDDGSFLVSRDGDIDVDIWKRNDKGFSHFQKLKDALSEGNLSASDEVLFTRFLPHSALTIVSGHHTAGSDHLTVWEKRGDSFSLREKIKTGTLREFFYITPDGKYAAFGNDYRASVIDLSPGENSRIRTQSMSSKLTHAGETVSDIFIEKNLTTAVIITNEGNLIRWNFINRGEPLRETVLNAGADRKERRRMKGSYNREENCAALYSTDSDEGIIVIRIGEKGPQQVTRIPCDNALISSLSFSNNGKLCAIGYLRFKEGTRVPEETAHFTIIATKDILSGKAVKL